MKPTFEQLLRWADDEARYQLNERAAIYEYDAGMPRELAEAQAAEDFLEGRSKEVKGAKLASREANYVSSNPLKSATETAKVLGTSRAQVERARALNFNLLARKGLLAKASERWADVARFLKAK